MDFYLVIFQSVIERNVGLSKLIATLCIIKQDINKTNTLLKLNLFYIFQSFRIKQIYIIITKMYNSMNMKTVLTGGK